MASASGANGSVSTTSQGSPGPEVEADRSGGGPPRGPSGMVALGGPSEKADVTDIELTAFCPGTETYFGL